MKLKLKDLKLNKKRQISSLQRILNLFNRRLRHMPRKLQHRRRKIKKKKNFSKPTKPKLELLLQARLNNSKQELKNSKQILKLPRKRLSKWLRSKPI
jgi:hypothetical protein